VQLRALRVRDAGDRYRVALGQHYDVMDPYRSLARSAMAEYGAFIRDREQLTQQIAKEQDPERRQALEIRKHIEANDYMAITSRRIASQSEVITGKRDSEEAVRFRERAAEYEGRSKELRQDFRDLAARRAEQMSNEPSHRSDAKRTADAEPARPERYDAKQADPDLGKGEISDAKAERIAKIREQGRAIANAAEARRSNPGQDRGGRSR